MNPSEIRYGRGRGTGQGGAAALFDPASLALSAWYRAAYAGSPWSSNASAGGSGSAVSLSVGTAPSVGAALNGFNTASCDGTTQSLACASGTIIPNNCSVGAWSISVLVNPAATAVAAVPGSSYQEPAIISETVQGYLYLTYTTSGFGIGHRDPTAGTWKQVYSAGAAGSWHLVQAYYDGANMYLEVDSLAAVSVATTDQGVTGVGPMKVGANYNSVARWPGLIAEVITATTNLGATARGNIKSYVNGRYGLSL